MNHKPKNLIIEIYRLPNDKRYVLAKTADHLRSEMQRVVPEVDPEPIVESLIAQQANPNSFPNLVLFLDGDGKQVAIDEYMGAYVKAKQKRIGHK